MNITEKRIFFVERLLNWDKKQNKRKMPWKGEKNPYRIWLSEVILQQTRVEQGLDYYNNFISTYPSVEMLAAAPENEVFKLWEGLGYYSRCRNLIASARHIAFELNGNFPDNYADILQLKGIGPYTAAAVASFAYDHPHAVTDGNVFRVLSRFFGIATPIDSTEGKKQFAKLADELLDKKRPAKYNQAIMDFGAVVCKPKLPLCDECPLMPDCTAFQKKLIDKLPVKAKKLVRQKRHFSYIVAEYANKIYVRQRLEKDIWKGLWEFIPVEEQQTSSPEIVLQKAGIDLKTAEIISISKNFRQQLTHRDVEAVFIRIKLKRPFADRSFTAVSKSELGKLAFPRIVNDFLENG